MIFITSNRKLHLFDNFWTQNTDYNYIYAENYMYKKFKKTVEIFKNQKKNRAFWRKYIKYILRVFLNVTLLEKVSFLY